MWLYDISIRDGHPMTRFIWRDSMTRFISVKLTWAPSRYPKRRLFVRSRKVSKPRDWYFQLSYRFEIWQAHRQHCYRSACQISERSDNSKYKSRDFEILRDLTERRLFGYWDGALDISGSHNENQWAPGNIQGNLTALKVVYRAITKSVGREPDLYLIDKNSYRTLMTSYGCLMCIFLINYHKHISFL